MKDLQRQIVNKALEVLAKENNCTVLDITTEIAKGNEIVKRNVLRVCEATYKELTKEH